MSDENDKVAIRQEALPQAIPANNLLTMIADAARDPNMNVEKMERLMAMHERLVANQQRTAFMAAMGRLTPKLPEIGKHGTSHHGKYARLEDIDRAIRPLIAEEGFSMSFDSIPVDGKVRVTCKLSHAEGHFETKQIDLPLDNSGSKNGAQSVISTVSYGRRALVKMFFNLIEAGEDTDGNSAEVISADQAIAICDLIKESGANERNFLELIAGTQSIEEIPARDYKRVMNALETKKRARK